MTQALCKGRPKHVHHHGRRAGDGPTGALTRFFSSSSSFCLCFRRSQRTGEHHAHPQQALHHCGRARWRQRQHGAVPVADTSTAGVGQAATKPLLRCVTTHRGAAGPRRGAVQAASLQRGLQAGRMAPEPSCLEWCLLGLDLERETHRCSQACSRPSPIERPCALLAAGRALSSQLTAAIALSSLGSAPHVPWCAGRQCRMRRALPAACTLFASSSTPADRRTDPRCGRGSRRGAGPTSRHCFGARGAWLPRVWLWVPAADPSKHLGPPQRPPCCRCYCRRTPPRRSPPAAPQAPSLCTQMGWNPLSWFRKPEPPKKKKICCACPETKVGMPGGAGVVGPRLVH